MKAEEVFHANHRLMREHVFIKSCRAKVNRKPGSNLNSIPG